MAIPADQLEMHRRFNRNSAGEWQGFAAHRERLTALVREQVGDTGAAAQGRLVILGPGNLNDIDLAQLDGFREIHLVDLDAEAVSRAVARQLEGVRARLTVHTPVDATGCLQGLRAHARRAPSAAELEAIVQAPVRTVLPTLPGPFDCVLSSCLLGQIMHSCRKALGPSPHLGAVAQALVMGHLNLIGQLTRAGGTALLVTDTVSSETYPLEELWGERSPLDLLTHLEQTENTFSGTGPTYLRRLLALPALRPLFAGARLVEPWLWRLGEKVTLLAYAYVLRRGS